MRNYILLGVSIVSGMLAFIVQQKSMVNAKNKRIKLWGKEVTIIGIKAPLAKGHEVSQEDLVKKRTFTKLLTRDPVTRDYTEVMLQNAGDVIGRKLNVDKPQNSTLYWGDFSTTRNKTFADQVNYSAVNNISERYIAVPIDQVSAVAGLIVPGNRVDILATFRFPNDNKSKMDSVTMTILQNVRIVAVGQNTGNLRLDRGKRHGGTSNITIAVTPKEAEFITFISQKSKITLTLRNPKDPFSEKNLQSVNFEYLEQHIKSYQKERNKRETNQ
ncbi:MAG: Flp pilus assembly protein CpaB [Lentisphaeria bacterium]|nr:Flp pilus assembly protein CpaB [Lentisphaeria bacterium]